MPYGKKSKPGTIAEKQTQNWPLSAADRTTYLGTLMTVDSVTSFLPSLHRIIRKDRRENGATHACNDSTNNTWHRVGTPYIFVESNSMCNLLETKR